MIEIVRITDCSTQEYQFTEELLTASFPEEEYRELAMLRKYVEKEKDFYYHIILHDEEPIGLVSFWQLSNYYYVEHLAVHTNKKREKLRRTDSKSTEREATTDYIRSGASKRRNIHEKNQILPKKWFPSLGL